MLPWSQCHCRLMRGGFSPPLLRAYLQGVLLAPTPYLLELLPGMVTCQTRTGWRKQATDSSM